MHLLLCLVTLLGALTFADIFLSTGGAILANSSVVSISDIREADSVVSCYTEHTSCCTDEDNPSGGAFGEWIGPNGTLVLDLNTITDSFSISRQTNMINLNVSNHRNENLIEGPYCCLVPRANSMNATICVIITGKWRSNTLLTKRIICDFHANHTVNTKLAVSTPCRAGLDSVWGIEWPSTERGSQTMQQCPPQLGDVISGKVDLHIVLCRGRGGYEILQNLMNYPELSIISASYWLWKLAVMIFGFYFSINKNIYSLYINIVGQATRFCGNNGKWAEPNVLQCQDRRFVNILERVCFCTYYYGSPLSWKILTQVTNSSVEELVEQAVNISIQLATITEPDDIPLLPSSLNITNQVLTQVIGALETEGGNSTTEATEVCGNFIVIYSNHKKVPVSR